MTEKVTVPEELELTKIVNGGSMVWWFGTENAIVGWVPPVCAKTGKQRPSAARNPKAAEHQRPKARAALEGLELADIWTLAEGDEKRRSCAAERVINYRR